MKKFDKFKASIEVVSGIQNGLTKDIPLMESHSIMTDNDGKRLDQNLEEIANKFVEIDEKLENGTGGAESGACNLEDGIGNGAVQQVADGVADGFEFAKYNEDGSVKSYRNAKAMEYSATLKEIVEAGKELPSGVPMEATNLKDKVDAREKIPYGATGDYSGAFGGISASLGKRSFSANNKTLAIGEEAVALGYCTVAMAGGAIATGSGTLAGGEASFSHGSDTAALGRGSESGGTDTIALADSSRTHGDGTRTYKDTVHTIEYDGVVYEFTANGYANNAEGRNTHSYGGASHSQGIHTHAIGDYSFAGGRDTIAYGQSTTTLGRYTFAGYENQFVCGRFNKNYEDSVFEVGNGDELGGKPSTAFRVLKDGRAKVQSPPIDPDDVVRLGDLPQEATLNLNIENGSNTGSIHQVADKVADGFDFTGKNANAIKHDSTLNGVQPYGGVGEYSSSFGGKSSAQGKRSHAQGTTTIAKGNYSHAEGDNSVAWGGASHAEGVTTVSIGYGSHAEGSTTVAIGDGSHAEGGSTTAEGTVSHAEGSGATASNTGANE